MDIRSGELARQKEWWNETGRHTSGGIGLSECSPYGYVNPTHNIYGGLRADTRVQFDTADGSELKGTRPKMGALHSSSALCVNTFQHWVDRDRAVLQRALGIEQPIVRLVLEHKFPNGMRGNDPNLDVALQLADGSVVAIECKYLEPFSGHAQGFKPSYFSKNQRRWSDLGLNAHQKLAENIQSGTTEPYEYLHAEQLLKHARGLAFSAKNGRCILGEPRSLFYLYSSPTDPEGKSYSQAIQHEVEIDRYAEAVQGDWLTFEALSYQDLIGRLHAECNGDEVHAGYLSYLTNRYLPGPASER